jgi:multidrug efflux pump subunit AcrA (membrane-fusion protein)
LLRLRRSMENGKMHAEKRPIKVRMGLADEEGYPHEGTVNLIDNQIDPATGSVSIRAVFANPKSPKGTPLLIPGMFVRLRMEIGEPRAAEKSSPSKEKTEK